MPVGRPSDYSLDLADLICSRISNGESMRSICRDDDMPAMQTIWRWLREKHEFSERYTRAKDESADAHAERIMEIAEQAMSADVNPNAARVAIDAYKWVASKLKPKRYGERIRADLAGDITVIVDHVKDPS